MADNQSISSKEEADISPERDEISDFSVAKDSFKQLVKDIPLAADIQEENPSESAVQESKLKEDTEKLVKSDISVDSKAAESNSAALTTELSLESDETKEKKHASTSEVEAKENSNISDYKEKSNSTSDLEATEEKSSSSSKLEENTPTSDELKVKENTEIHTTSNVSEPQENKSISEQTSLPVEIQNLNETNLPAKAEIDESTDQSTNMAKEDSKKESIDAPLSKEAPTRVPENAAEPTQDMFGMTEEEALAFLKEENDAKKALASAGPPKIELYGSSVSGNMKIKKAQNKMMDTLERFKILYDFIDLAADEQAKLYIKRKNPTSTTIPQLYINGEFKMVFQTGF
ncbi:hypothetical protein DSO57_1034196 [Entomophthora muscae]|uniref:Uncharacterized protein n=1 Tax=Entomophthora muscae TaxID=34485 RepID=A0ACC2UAN8_9FUNG|nr:hypothetical protein DSO57_1034196 [Entomophthora muscae]